MPPERRRRLAGDPGFQLREHDRDPGSHDERRQFPGHQSPNARRPLAGGPAEERQESRQLCDNWGAGRGAQQAGRRLRAGRDSRSRHLRPHPGPGQAPLRRRHRILDGRRRLRRLQLRGAPGLLLRRQPRRVRQVAQGP